jgi:anti-sigma regulatory factor (Ser/Thr protein kinase)
MTGRSGIMPGSPAADTGPAGQPDADVMSRPVLRMSALDLAAMDTAVPSARLHARHIACEWEHAALAEDCELIVAELVTNAVQAVTGLGGATGPPPIRLRLTRRDHGIQAEVWDGSDKMPDPHRTRPADEPGGLGTGPGRRPVQSVGHLPHRRRWQVRLGHHRRMTCARRSPNGPQLPAIRGWPDTGPETKMPADLAIALINGRNFRVGTAGLEPATP